MKKDLVIDFNRCFRALRNKFWMILLGAAIAFLVAFLCTCTNDENVYSAESTVFSAVYGSYSESVESTKAIIAYADIIKSLKVSERAAVLLGDDTLKGKDILKMIDVEYSLDSPILHIKAYCTDSEKAIRVSKAVANAFIIEVKNITGVEQVEILDEAYYAKEFYNSTKDHWKKRIVAVIVTMFLVALGICTCEVFSNKVVRIEDCTLDGQIELLAIIPKYNDKKVE